MLTTPTYVIGVGGVGGDIVTALADQQQTTDEATQQFGLLAIDSDSEALSDRDDVATVHLTSGSGVVSRKIAEYPFLAPDMTIPAEGAGQLRHVGRYKLDSPVSPTFGQHKQTIETRLQSFVKERAVNLRKQSHTYTVALVFSLAGGTGSGAFPLLAATLSRITAQLETEDRDVRLVAFGLVPPLDFDPRSSLPPVSPIGYPNTYAALRNLSTLFGATDGKQLELPVYSKAGTASGEREGFDTPGETFTMTAQPFDAFWLVSNDVSGRKNKQLRGTQKIAGALRRTLQLLPAGTSSSRDVWSRSSPVSALGTVEYAMVSVPHRALRNYCELKRERTDLERERQQSVEPRLAALQQRRNELEEALQMQVEDVATASEWLDPLDDYLPDDATTPLGLGPDQSHLETAMERVTERSDPLTYIRTARALNWMLTDGNTGSELRSEIRQSVADIRDQHDFELLSEHRTVAGTLEEQLDGLERALSERKERCQRELDGAGMGIRDALPPTNELFTSERERLEAELTALDRQLERVAATRAKLDTLKTKVALSETHIQRAQERVKAGLDELERDISQFARRRDRIDKRVEQLDREISSLRESLVNPDNRRGELVVPLDWSELADLGLETVESDLTSIRAYMEHGLLDCESGELQRILRDCYEQSRDWPEGVARHENPLAAETVHEETAVLSHPANSTILEGIGESLTGPGTVHVSAAEDTPHTDDPYRVEIVSLSQGGRPETLLGFKRLQQMRDDGILEAMSGRYQDSRRALAYPEWYEEEVGDAFE